MDFYTIKARSAKNGVTEVYPDYKIVRSKDLMVRGKAFYAIWDETKGLWSTDEYDVQRLVDADLYRFAEELSSRVDGTVVVKALGDFSSNSWLSFRNYVGHVSDSSTQLDEKLTFANTEVNKNDYVSRRLPYSLRGGDISAYDELVGTLYDPSERSKLEWAIGSVVAGDSRFIQKFVVLYGAAGAGKSTAINIVQELFRGYTTTFEAAALTGSSNTFSTEPFRSNPLVAIQHDGDLSRIEDNTKLNSVVSHEEMPMNEKFKPVYTARVNALLFIGTNKPVKITDAKSGIIRRLIDIRPSGRLVPEDRYFALVSQIQFELGAIAQHCLDTYLSMGKNYYAGYRPVEMMLQTNVFFNFIEAHYDQFAFQDGATLAQAYDLYKAYCEDSLVEYRLSRHKFRDEFKNYFHEFHEQYRLDDVRVRSYYSGFIKERFMPTQPHEIEIPMTIDNPESIIDHILEDCPAQYANDYETPSRKWSDVTTTLKEIETGRLHYVKVPENHIVIDFDLKDAEGQKDAEMNLRAASQWPTTYAEWSKGGSGIHLHYLYEGDVGRLSRIFGPGIEIKVFTGDSSLRRLFTSSNGQPIATLSEGLPLKEEKVLDFDTVRSERGLRNLVERNLRKEIHGGTKPSIDFIHKILSDAYKSDLVYDLSDLRGAVLTFAMNSSNQAEYCVNLVSKMEFISNEESVAPPVVEEVPLVIYDTEVFPNLFVLCWKFKGEDREMVEWVNPTPAQVEELLRYNLVGFNVRKYDNHILYGAYMGYTNEQLYALSQKIISNDPSALFREAYNASYTDIYDFASKKQSLKKWQIELGIHHLELGLPWDEPVPEELIPKVVEYCSNDVITTEAVFDARSADFLAREILASLSGLTVNDTTNRHTMAIIFGKERKPQRDFVYTDLSEMFPGYKYDFGKSTYRGEEVGEGGLVRSKPGMYTNVAVLDVASMHPTSIVELNLFGPYTKIFYELVQARIAIKHGDYDAARLLLGGKLAPYLKDVSQAKALADALKIAINSVYGLTAASFENPFRDIRNKDNIVAKRGALFMLDLMYAVEEKGFSVIHIKTDSIKIPEATPEIIAFVQEFGRKYGYEFEHEETYSRMCLVNDAVYIAMGSDGKWTATGAQFQHPYVFKLLFSHEEITFDDMCETKAVSTALYLDFNEQLPEGEHDRRFIGRVGRFLPVIPGSGGGELLREKDGEFHSATGTKGYRWMEAEIAQKVIENVDISHPDITDVDYFIKLTDDAVDTISKYGDFEWFVSTNNKAPWEE